MIGAALVDGTVEPIRQEIAAGDGRGWVIDQPIVQCQQMACPTRFERVTFGPAGLQWKEATTPNRGVARGISSDREGPDLLSATSGHGRSSGGHSSHQWTYSTYAH